MVGNIMKIVHPDINMQIDFEDKTCCIWTIESPELLLNYSNFALK